VIKAGTKGVEAKGIGGPAENRTLFDGALGRGALKERIPPYAEINLETKMKVALGTLGYERAKPKKCGARGRGEV